LGDKETGLPRKCGKFLLLVKAGQVPPPANMETVGRVLHTMASEIAEMQ
jgi:hypothetical protein